MKEILYSKINTDNFHVFFYLGTVTTKMLEEEESVNAIRQLTEQFDEVSDETAVETHVYTAPF